MTANNDPAVPSTFAYRFKEGQALPTGLSFTRGSTATLRRRSGLLATAAINVARHQYAVDGIYLGVLLEEEAENSCLYSEDVSNAAWSKTRVNYTTNAITDPFGTSWDKVYLNTSAATQHYITQSHTWTNGTTYCRSRFFKAGELEWVRMLLPGARFGGGGNVGASFDLANGVVGTQVNSPLSADMEDYGNGWWRCWISAACTSSGTSAFEDDLAEGNNDTIIDGDGASGIYVGGCQIDTSRTTPSSYIPTTSSSASRAQDDMIGDLETLGFNIPEGTFYWEGTLGNPAGSAGLLYAYESGTKGIALAYENGKFRMRSRDGSSLIAEVAYTPSRWEIVRVAASWDAGGLAISVNGSVVATQAGAQTPSPSEFRIGRGAPGLASYNQNGTILAFAVYDRAVADATLVDMSQSGIEISELLYQPETLRRRYIMVNDYVPADDAQDAYPGILQAMADGEHREIVWGNPLGGRRTYRIPNRGDTIAWPEARHILHPGVVLDFSDWGIDAANRYAINYTSGGSVAGKVYLTTKCDPGDKEISVADGSSFQAGDYIVLGDDREMSDPSSAGENGEITRILRVSGNTLMLTRVSQGEYFIGSNAYVRKITPWRGSVEGEGAIMGPGRWTSEPGDTGFRIRYGTGEFLKGSIEIVHCDYNAWRIEDCFDGSISGVKWLHEHPGSNTNVQYGMSLVGYSTELAIMDLVGNGGKHGVVGTGPTQRGIKVAFCEINGTWHAAYIHHGEAAEELTYIGNTAKDCNVGFDIRNRGVTLNGNRIRDVWTTNHYGLGLNGQGIQITTYAQDLRIIDTDITGGLYGIDFDESSLAAGSAGVPKNIEVQGLKLRGQAGFGARFDWQGTGDGEHLVIRGVNADIANGHCIEVGKFKGGLISDVYAEGNGFRAVWLKSNTSKFRVDNVAWKGFISGVYDQGTGNSVGAQLDVS